MTLDLKSTEPMRRTTIRYLIPAVLMALTGCNPEPVPVPANVESAGQATVTFNFGVQEYEETGTKSVAADIADDQVDRIDIYSYDAEGKALLEQLQAGELPPDPSEDESREPVVTLAGVLKRLEEIAEKMKDDQMTFFQSPTEIKNLKSAHSFAICFSSITCQQ